MNGLFSEFAAWLLRHRGKVAGTLVGLLLGWSFVTYGVFKTLFIAACLIGGYIVGTWLDEGPPGRRGAARRR